MTASKEEITGLVREWRAGKEEALHELLPVVYRELRKLAQSQLARESPSHTLQPTALVNEVYLRLVDAKAGTIENRTHFFAFAARLMRQILVDHARALRTSKRGGGAPKVGLDEAIGLSQPDNLDLATIIAVDSALEKLEALDPRQARIVELRYFSGLTMPEIAGVMEISLATVERQWAFARRWLARRIEQE